MLHACPRPVEAYSNSLPRDACSRDAEPCMQMREEPGKRAFGAARSFPDARPLDFPAPPRVDRAEGWAPDALCIRAAPNFVPDKCSPHLTLGLADE